MKQLETDNILTGETFIFLSLPRHDGQYTSTPWQLAKVIAQSYPVYFVDNPFTFSDLMTGFYKPQIRKRLKAMLGGDTSTTIDGVEVIYPPFVLPVNFLPKGGVYNFLSRWNQRRVAERINKVLKNKNVHSTVYINSFNFYFPALFKYLKVDVKLKVYHCIDPMVKAFTLKHGKYLQDRAADNSDLVVSTAPSLQHQFLKRGIHKSYLVPNAADFDLFNQARMNKAHPSVSTIAGRVFGYLGNVERRTDFTLLLKVIELLPDWTLVMAGPVDRQYAPVEFLNHPRIHFTGSIPHKDAPSVINRFDVAIIPFKCDDVSSGIYPLKLFEYLAAGKPVISTNFNPEILKTLADVVHVANTAEEFANSILKAYSTDSEEKQITRISVASENTWESRARLFKSIISIEFKDKFKSHYVTQGQNQKQPQA